MSTNDQFHDRRYSKLCIVFRSRVKLEWHLIYIFTFFVYSFNKRKKTVRKVHWCFLINWILYLNQYSMYRQQNIQTKKKSSQHYDEQLLLLNVWHHNSLTMLKGVNNRVVSYLTFYLTMLYHIYYSILVKSFLCKKRQIIIFMFYRYV